MKCSWRRHRFLFLLVTALSSPWAIQAAPPPRPVITSASSATETVGAPFSYQITTHSPTSFMAARLPLGLSVNAGTGLISGTPATTGVSTSALSATNAGGTGTLTLTLVVQATFNGPLHVLPANPGYFTDNTGKAIYLTGSHNWYSLQDSGVVGEPLSVFVDFSHYLDFLQTHNHNFIRLWAYEDLEADNNPQYYRPLPYAQTGPGEALDGTPRFDLTAGQFDPSYFDRLRSRVVAARDRGIYVSIMLFQGWSVDTHGSNPWPGHWLNGSNNINGIDGDPTGTGHGDAVHTLAYPMITELQEAYVRQVVDTVGDLDNVLYEISNEDDATSVDWQNHMVDFVHGYEAEKSKQHPVGMTCNSTDDSNASLFASHAEWISPCASDFDDVSVTYSGQIPVAPGSKVILLDTDHIGYQMFTDDGNFSRSWVWRSFTQGYNPLLMEDLADAGFEPARQTMGETLWWAQRINLLNDAPHPELSSTGYALANPGQEYLVYAPGGGTFTVNLTSVSGSIRVQWYNPSSGQSTPEATVNGGGTVSFTSPPFGGDAVLYLLKKASPR